MHVQWKCVYKGHTQKKKKEVHNFPPIAVSVYAGRDGSRARHEEHQNSLLSSLCGCDEAEKRWGRVALEGNNLDPGRGFFAASLYWSCLLRTVRSFSHGECEEVQETSACSRSWMSICVKSSRGLILKSICNITAPNGLCISIYKIQVLPPAILKTKPLLSCNVTHCIWGCNITTPVEVLRTVRTSYWIYSTVTYKPLTIL